MDTTTSLQNAGTLEADPVARDQLLTSHLGLVHHVAHQLSRSLSTEMELDELVSAGTIGLINAVDSFDASRGLAFSTFAAPRIRGAILDELRRQDHAPRSVRRKSREVGAARESLTRQLGRLPTERELADQLEIDMDTLWKWQADIEGVSRVPLDRPAGDQDASTPIEVLVGSHGQKIEDDLNLQQEVRVLREAITELKEQERVVLSLYYFEELKLHEIATILRLTESRVSQIRSKAIAKLRGMMSPLREQKSA